MAKGPKGIKDSAAIPEPPKRLVFHPSTPEDDIPPGARAVAEVVANDHFVRENLRTMNERLRQQNALTTDLVRLVRDMQENQPIQLQLLDCVRDVRDLLQQLLAQIELNREAITGNGGHAR